MDETIPHKTEIPALESLSVHANTLGKFSKVSTLEQYFYLDTPLRALAIPSVMPEPP
jgi:hypothetical protein